MRWRAFAPRRRVVNSSTGSRNQSASPTRRDSVSAPYSRRHAAEAAPHRARGDGPPRARRTRNVEGGVLASENGNPQEPRIQLIAPLRQQILDDRAKQCIVPYVE